MTPDELTGKTTKYACIAVVNSSAESPARFTG